MVCTPFRYKVMAEQDNRTEYTFSPFLSINLSKALRHLKPIRIKVNSNNDARSITPLFATAVLQSGSIY